MRRKGEATTLVMNALAKMDDGVSGDIAKATGLTIGYTTLLLRQLVQDKKAVRVRHGVYRSMTNTAARAPYPAPVVRSKRTLPAAAPETGEVVQLLQESTATLREILEHAQAIERLLLAFKPGNPQARIEVFMAAGHLLRAADWITGVARPELPRPMGGGSSEEVNRELSGRQ
jgi:hypothetical protein